LTLRAISKGQETKDSFSRYMHTHTLHTYAYIHIQIPTEFNSQGNIKRTGNKRQLFKIYVHTYIHTYTYIHIQIPTEFDTQGNVRKTGNKRQLFEIYACTSMAVFVGMGAFALTMSVWDVRTLGTCMCIYVQIYACTYVCIYMLALPWLWSLEWEHWP
jgi:hypothetical protein